MALRVIGKITLQADVATTAHQQEGDSLIESA